QGLFVVDSSRGVVTGNRCAGNGRIPTSWLFGAQIALQNTDTTEVVGNRLTVPAVASHGVVLMQQDRGTHLCTDNLVRDNDIDFLGSAGVCGAAADSAAERMIGNRFDGNRYRARESVDQHWAWAGRSMDFVAFQAAGQERSGSLVIDAGR
nr:hypothetical protein [Planctomycetota bacterium]